MNTKTLLKVFLIAVISAMVFFLAGLKIGSMACQQPEPVVQRDTIWTTDTVILRVTETDTVTKYINKVVKVPLYAEANDTEVDSAMVRLPFEQHFASLEDVADIWYSGFMPRLDSAVIYKHRQTVIEKHYITQSGKHNIIAVEAGPRDASLLYIRRFGTIYAGLSAGCTYDGEATARGFLGFQF